MSRFICTARIIAAKQVTSSFSIGKPATSIFFRSFGGASHSGDDHGHHSDTFLDPKMVSDRVIEVVKNFEKVNKGKVSATARFKEDLDLDSLDAVEVVMACEDEFVIEIPDSEADKFFAINDVTDFIANHPMAK